MSTSTHRVKPRDIVLGRSIKNNIARSFYPSCRNVDRVLRELPDRDERAQNQAWIHYELEGIATLFFGANQKGVSGLLLVLRLICRVRLFIHAINFTRQVLAAMTIIIKFLPRYYSGTHPTAEGRRLEASSRWCRDRRL